MSKAAPERTPKLAAIVAGMVELGAPREMIARALATSVTTLRRRYADVLKPQKPGRKPADEDFGPEVATMVEALAGLGMKLEPLAKLLGISKTSLLRHFGEAIDTAQERLDMQVINALYRNATLNMVPSAQIFWLKARRGWRDRTVLEHEGHIDHEHHHAIEHDLEKRYRRMTPAEREAYKLVLAAFERMDVEDAAAAEGPGSQESPPAVH